MATNGEADLPDNAAKDVPEHGGFKTSGLNLDTSSWEGTMNSFFLWAAKEPWTFLYYVMLCLSPFFLISAILSFKLSKIFEKQERAAANKRRRSPRQKHPKSS